MTVKNRPCKGCEKRQVGCHATCQEYLEDKEKFEAWRNKNNEYYIAREFQAKSIRRVKKLRQKRK